MSEIIEHPDGYSIIPEGDTSKKKRVYGYTSIGVTQEDRTIIRKIAKQRGMKIHTYMHELVTLALAQQKEIPKCEKTVGTTQFELPEFVVQIGKLFDRT